MKLSDIDVKGITFEIEVNSQGRFSAIHDGTDVTADSMEELKQKMNKLVSRIGAKVSIPFVRWERERDNEPGRLRRGTLTGVHAANANLLIKWEDDSKVRQDRTWGIRSEFIRDDMAEQYQILCEAKERAVKLLEEFEQTYGFNGRTALSEALEKAGKKEAADAVR